MGGCGGSSPRGISGRAIGGSLPPFLQHQILGLGEYAVLVTITFKSVESINFVFLFQECFGHCRSFAFPYELIIGLSISA